MNLDFIPMNILYHNKAIPTIVSFDEYFYNNNIIGYAITREVEDGKQIYFFWDKNIYNEKKFKGDINFFANIRESFPGYIIKYKAGTLVREYIFYPEAIENGWCSFALTLLYIDSDSFFIKMDNNIIGYIIRKIQTLDDPSKSKIISYYTFIDKKIYLQNKDIIKRIKDYIFQKKKPNKRIIHKLFFCESLDKYYI